MVFEENIFKSQISGNKKETLDDEYGNLLWKKLEIISAHLRDLGQEADQLYEEIETITGKNLGLHQLQLQKGKEDAYWKLQKEISELKKEEGEAISALDNMEKGVIDEDNIKKLIAGLKSENENRISKRKQRVMEERARLGDGYDAIDYGPGGRSQVAHPTTGRHMKSVKMNTDSFSAANEFFHYTADTHGGKVEAGKHGNLYASKSGKMIRKK